LAIFDQSGVTTTLKKSGVVSTVNTVGWPDNVQIAGNSSNGFRGPNQPTKSKQARNGSSAQKLHGLCPQESASLDARLFLFIDFNCIKNIYLSKLEQKRGSQRLVEAVIVSISHIAISSLPLESCSIPWTESVGMGSGYGQR
jgi:hypothetical protein